MRKHGRTDLVHGDIVVALRQIGCSVQSLAAVGDGCPDLLIGYRGRNMLLEVKQPKGQLTPAQEIWLAVWHGSATVVYSVADAVAQCAVTTVERGIPPHP